MHQFCPHPHPPSPTCIDFLPIHVLPLQHVTLLWFTMVGLLHIYVVTFSKMEFPSIHFRSFFPMHKVHKVLSVGGGGVINLYFPLHYALITLNLACWSLFWKLLVVPSLHNITLLLWPPIYFGFFLKFKTILYIILIFLIIIKIQITIQSSNLYRW